jgi:hypothetical protein
MPRIPIDYSKACVYRLVFNYITYYVGSTTNFRRRKCEHKNRCKNENDDDYNKPLYKFIRETGGWSDDWDMVLVKHYPECKSGIELRMYERKHYEFYRPEFNMNNPYQDNDELVEYKKQHYIENLVHYTNYKAQYYIDNLDKINERSKQYYTENLDAIKEVKKDYYLQNRDRITEKHNCECGGKYSTGSISRHNKCQKHIKYLNNLSTINGNTQK